MKNKRGFTLIEILVTLTLVVVVAGLMYTFLGQGISLYTMQNEAAQEQMNMRQVLSDITNRIRLTDPANITYSNDVLHVGDTTYYYSSVNNEILRNGTTLATGIGGFTVLMQEGLLEISIVSTAGTVVSTSFSLG